MVCSLRTVSTVSKSPRRCNIHCAWTTQGEIWSDPVPLKKVGFPWVPRAKNQGEIKEVGTFGGVYKWWLCFWILLFLWVLGSWHMVTSKKHSQSQEVTNLKPFGAVNQCRSWYNTTGRCFSHANLEKHDINNNNLTTEQDSCLMLLG